MLKLEEENNRIFIEAYGLEDELTPDVPIEEITLTCNPYYRYGNNKSEAELEVLLLADTMREFISYAVGCMFGRYSLDKPGLVLANQGDTLQEYLAQVPAPTFMPDADNVIPILDGDWFADDIVERFKEFLRITFGKEHYEENLAFIESAIGKDIRKFFLKDFYTDHVKRYKKRPIYWLFTSPRGTFNALIYMHRYRPDTVSVVLNKYLREFKVKLHARLDQLRRIEVGSDASKADKARAIKAIDTLRKDLDELDQWERDVIFPLAVKQIEIDLDDGVKVNYPKFGTALKKIPGLEANED
jgi:type II restriction/modification system DNA methylase subunit YeeA